MRPRHIVMATSVSGTPNLPEIPTLDRFAGPVVHSSGFKDGAAWRGKTVLVFGTGTSAHDIAQDLHGNGAEVTMVQRSPTLIVNVEPSAQLYDGVYYGKGPTLEDRDLINTSFPVPVMKRAHRLLTDKAREYDAPLLQGLERVGFRLDFGEDGTGWPLKYRTRGGGYYFNVGCSDLVAAGAIGLAQYQDIEEFTPAGPRMKDGRVLQAGLIVLATGYKGQDHLVGTLFGPEVAARVGKVWGFDDGAGAAQHVDAHAAARASGSPAGPSRSAGCTRNTWRCRSRRRSLAWSAADAITPGPLRGSRLGRRGAGQGVVLVALVAGDLRARPVRPGEGLVGRGPVPPPPAPARRGGRRRRRLPRPARHARRGCGSSPAPAGCRGVASIASASAAGMGYSNSARLSRPGPLMVRNPSAPASRTRTTGAVAVPAIRQVALAQPQAGAERRGAPALAGDQEFPFDLGGHGAGRPGQARIQVSEKASIAVLILCPATSRGTGLPGRVRPSSSIVALSQPTKTLGM